jgi:hypothetical protein
MKVIDDLHSQPGHLLVLVFGMYLSLQSCRRKHLGLIVCVVHMKYTKCQGPGIRLQCPTKLAIMANHLRYMTHRLLKLV